MTSVDNGSDPELRGRIRELERAAAPLDPDEAERGRLLGAVEEYVKQYLRTLPDRPAYEAEKDAASKLSELGPGPHPIDRLLGIYEEAVVVPGIAPTAGGHLGYIPGGGIYTSALGDYLAAVTNEYAGVRFASPGAVDMENGVLEWMAGLIGYPPTAKGNLAPGGSVANFTGVVTARHAADIRARDVPDAVVYSTSQTHHCVDRALRVAGLGETVRREIPLDDRYRMRPGELARVISSDRERGLRPWLVIATAGTTDVGAIDPLPDVADIAESEGLWLHVDAAYGGFFTLVESVRPRLAGLERADSIVLDPHKTLFLPYGTAALLVRDGELLRRAHAYRASYMQDAEAEELAGGGSPADLSLELTKHFRGPRVWLPLMLHGTGPFRACLEEKIELARYFHRGVAKLGFEVGPDPELTVSTYRWVPAEGDPNDFNRALTEYVHRDGRAFVTSTMLDGTFVLRAAIVVFRTHLEEIDRTLEILEAGVAELEAHPERWRRDRVTSRARRSPS